MMELFGALFLLLGSAAIFGATWGLVHLPDVYCRCHAAGKASTVGVLGLMTGSALLLGNPDGFIIAALVTLFIFIKNPVGSHALGRAAWKAGVPMWSNPSDIAAKDPPQSPHHK
jgi:multicomponent Na+:H+ antiporter subunit G